MGGAFRVVVSSLDTLPVTDLRIWEELKVVGAGREGMGKERRRYERGAAMWARRCKVSDYLRTPGVSGASIKYNPDLDNLMFETQ